MEDLRRRKLRYLKITRMAALASQSRRRVGGLAGLRRQLARSGIVPESSHRGHVTNAKRKSHPKVAWPVSFGACASDQDPELQAPVTTR